MTLENIIHPRAKRKGDSDPVRPDSESIKRSIERNRMAGIESVLQDIENHGDDTVDFLMRLIAARPVTPNYDVTGRCSERACSQLVGERIRNMGHEPVMEDVDLALLEPYRGLPGFVEGFTDEIDFSNRPNVMVKFPGRNPGKAKSLLLAGHLDVVAADNVDDWEVPPFQPEIRDGFVRGRGSVDMLGGFVAMLAAMEALQRAGAQLDADVWLAGIVGEEAGGTGGLYLADYLKRNGVRLDAGIMGEPTNLDLSLLCRDIQWADVIVRGRTGHLEVEQPHWSEGGPVDAIDKARLILGLVDELNREWARRPDKNHPLLGIPCQVKLAMIEGGHHRSSYPDHCRMSFNIQVLPGESDENGLGRASKEEFYAFMNRAFDADPWMREHRPEIVWVAEADCSEVSRDEPLVDRFIERMRAIHPAARVTGSEFHTDTGWFQRLNGIPMVNFGPGNPALAHMTNEKCPARDVIAAAKIIAAICLDWCVEKQ